MKTLNTYIGIILLLFFAAPDLTAQATYQISDDSKMVIKGTSSLHDWESDVVTLKGRGMVNVENQQPHIRDFHLTIPVEAIKSGKSAMDNNTYEALNEESYPNIEFSLDEVQSISGGKVKASGELSIAGETRPVTLTADYDLQDSNLISLRGSYTMKMTDFGVDPPTAVFGTIKTGDEITVDYTLQLKKSN